MDNLKIILFICNWGPHAAFQTLLDSGADIPAEVRMIRIPCTGSMSKSLLFRAFEMGADGVALVGCEPGSCRYGSGTEVAERNVEDTRGILDLLGLGGDRLRQAMFLPEESGALLAFLQDFHQVIQTIGKSPVIPAQPQAASPIQQDAAAQVMREHDIFACQDCGKCASACPVALAGKAFSPRAMAGAILAGNFESPAVIRDVWSCLTCGLCHDRCPSDVDFPEFIRDMRILQKMAGKEGCEAHEGFFQSYMRAMTSPGLQIRHWDWLPADIRTDPASKTLFFGGCAPYFDTYFKAHLGIQTRDILVDGLRLLNFFDIHPALLAGERCCGHDLLWSGDRENFLKLARLNVAAIEAAGIEEVVTACPECYRTLAHDYPAQGVGYSFRVTHLFDLAEQEISKGAIGFEKLDRALTFQDPCCLSRLEGRPELPRKLLSRLNPHAFTEMQDRGASALCCGNCAWTGCDSFTKALQVKRLRQAKATGSDLLVTACPKCQIHLRCAMEDPFVGNEIEMELMDLTSILARTIRWE
ncbi:hydrogenase iron-sulfur subunit [Desulfatirhabdium butyrativorans]|uniref:hydrogenase iron-sulfur subunit n=1 Tax=Desulfatirhabdium butyrativorans TaxID=340467 RepID=UPI0004081B7E|nr:hydrogenase iron-sulfur subunit [Desulfatirhabdium butyrativorans]